jgi:hypothetical protein
MEDRMLETQDRLLHKVMSATKILHRGVPEGMVFEITNLAPQKIDLLKELAKEALSARLKETQ